MSEDHKMRVQRAMEKHHEQLIKKSAPKRRNSRPERDLVQVPCVDWMRSRGWDIQIYEAKATFDPRRNVWRNQSMKAGTCDCMGIDDLANAVFVEFKAPGKRSTFNAPKNYKQKRFLVEKLDRGAFAVVVDNVVDLSEIYEQWLRLGTREERISYLRSKLP